MEKCYQNYVLVLYLGGGVSSAVRQFGGSAAGSELVQHNTYSMCTSAQGGEEEGATLAREYVLDLVLDFDFDFDLVLILILDLVFRIPKIHK